MATIAFGMGIDKKDIRRIIHYDPPKSLGKLQSKSAGPAGRDGNVTFAGKPITGRRNGPGNDLRRHPGQECWFLVACFHHPAELRDLSGSSNCPDVPRPQYPRSAVENPAGLSGTEGIIRPKATYFVDEYAFKLMVDPVLS
ncbi:MAG: hypothetical protein R2860_03825 [Desulfobacterales bacterium]